MSPGLGIALRFGRFFLMFSPKIIQFGRITSNVITGMSVTQSVKVGHIATLPTLTLGGYEPEAS